MGCERKHAEAVEICLTGWWVFGDNVEKMPAGCRRYKAKDAGRMPAVLSRDLYVGHTLACLVFSIAN